MRYLRYTLIVFFVFIVSLDVEAKKVKLSKNIVYEGTVQNGEPNGKGCLKVYSCLDKNLTLLTLNGDFNNTEIKDASIKINGGIVIEASKVVYYKLATPSKKEDVIEFHMYLCSIKNNEGIEVKNVLSSIFAYGCDKEADKRWHFFADANSVEFPITRNGIISSKGLRNSLSSEKYGQADSMTSLWNAATSFSDGAERNKANAKFLLSPTFSGSGVISSSFLDYNTPLSSIGDDASNIKKQDVNYRFFVTAPENADEALGIELLSAQKTYLSSGTIIEHMDNSFYCKYPNASYIVLNKDGSVNNYKITLEGGNIERSPYGTTIVYKDGNTFTSSDNNPIKVAKNIASCINVFEVTILNGDLSHPNGIVDIYCDGNIVGHKFPLKDRGWFIRKNNKKNGLIYPDGSKFVASTEDGLLQKKDYSTDNDTKDYTLVTGVFTNGLGHKTEYINGEIQTKDFDDIKQMAVGRSIVELSVPDGQGQGIGYCSENGCLYFPFLEAKEPKQIDKKHYYIKVKDGLCLSFPKSFVLKSGDDVADIQTVDFRSKKGGMFGMEWLGSKYTLVWVYEPVSEINNVQYGITKGVWVVNKTNNKIVHDLCKCLKSGNNNRYNWVYDNTPYVDKRKYHARGRIETCSWCGGSGDMSDWRAGHYIRCTTCGGKGWVVEHYW
ncbi:hypothetical protein [uncultured Prevotella sp.]|uniref:hypothetical protein n=1 Tax=uncultured Prevotella sp. TaxID=159272 RepID=UPI0026066B09|nr:hypothetical protein [uncultured Prevotella sp.]